MTLKLHINIIFCYMSSSAYVPPSPNTIALLQNEVGSLRLLIAQRKLYSFAKRWANSRLFGMGIIALLAPVVAIIWPQCSVVVGAISGLWIFFGRTTFLIWETNFASKAASVQELFDLKVFQMPQIASRVQTPLLEDICKLAGPDDGISDKAKDERLIDWYVFNINDSGFTAVALCQRINAFYSWSLLRTASFLWLTLIIFWTIILIMVSAFLGLSLVNFLLAVFLPLLPAFLDTYELWTGIRLAEKDRREMIIEIEEKLHRNDVTGQDLIKWQSRMYELRVKMPRIPDKIYWITRNVNERVMKTAVKQLADENRQ